MNTSYISKLIDLLAVENINFQIADIKTAQFCMETRELQIPSYVFNTNNITMIEWQICHEIAHALFTPKSVFKDHSTYSPLLINYLEDIRVENLLKEKFLGVGKSLGFGFIKFNEMFNEFTEQNVKQKTQSLLFIDKINFYFKSNYMMPVDFTVEEYELVNELKLLKDYSQLKVMMDRLIEFNKNKKPEVDFGDNNTEEKTTEEETGISTWGSEEESTEEESTEEENSLEENSEVCSGENSPEEETSSSTGSGSFNDMEEEIKDESSILNQGDGSELFDNSEYTNQEEFFEQEIKSKNTTGKYYFLEEQDATNIVPEDFIWKEIKKFWTPIRTKVMIDSLYESVVKNSQLLSIEFNRKKNATNYKNVIRTKTGTLDLSRLSSYKTSPNIFQENKKFKKQKNHEVVILLDWSGSICRLLPELMIQAASIVLFCKKNNIPCRVLAFSDYPFAISKFRSFRTIKDNNTFHNAYVLFELLTATGDMETKIKDFLNLAFSIRTVSFLELHSTPLYDSLLNIPTLLKKLYHSNKITSLVILTDGVSNQLISKNKQFNYIYDFVFDKDSKRIYKNVDFKCDIKSRDFLFRRLHNIVPNVKIVNVFVSDKMNRCTNFTGMLKITDDKHKQNIVEQIRKKQYAVVNYKDFTSIRFIQRLKDSTDNQDVLLNNNKIININKKDALSIIKQLTNSLSSIIFKKIAENIA